VTLRPPGRAVEPEVLTVDQAAGYLQIHRATVYKYIREGLLPAVRLGKVYRLLRPDVEAFLQARRVGAAPEEPTGRDLQGGRGPHSGPTGSAGSTGSAGPTGTEGPV